MHACLSSTALLLRTQEINPLQATLASATDSLARHRALFTHWRTPSAVDALWDLAVLVRDGTCPGACERVLELHWRTVGAALGRQAQQREAVRHEKVGQAVDCKLLCALLWHCGWLMQHLWEPVKSKVGAGQAAKAAGGCVL